MLYAVICACDFIIVSVLSVLSQCSNSPVIFLITLQLHFKKHTQVDFIFRVVLASQQNWESTENSYIAPPLTQVGLPTVSIPWQRGAFVTINEPTLAHHYHSKPVFYSRVQSWCVHPRAFDKGVMTCRHNRSITQNSCTVLKFFYALPIHSSFPPNSWLVVVFMLKYLLLDI